MFVCVRWVHNLCVQSECVCLCTLCVGCILKNFNLMDLANTTINWIGLGIVYYKCRLYLSSIFMSRQYDSESANLGCPLRIAET